MCVCVCVCVFITELTLITDPEYSLAIYKINCYFTTYVLLTLYTYILFYFIFTIIYILILFVYYLIKFSLK